MLNCAQFAGFFMLQKSLPVMGSFGSLATRSGQSKERHTYLLFPRFLKHTQSSCISTEKISDKPNGRYFDLLEARLVFSVLFVGDGTSGVSVDVLEEVK